MLVTNTDTFHLLEYFEGNCPVQDGSVGIATRYELDGPGIKARWREKHFAPL